MFFFFSYFSINSLLANPILQSSLFSYTEQNLPTSRQLVSSYSSSAIKGKISTNELGSSAIKGKVFDNLGFSSAIKFSNKPGSSSAIKDTDQVSEKLDEFLEKWVYKDKRSAFKLLREIEKKNFNLEIAKKDKKSFS